VATAVAETVLVLMTVGTSLCDAIRRNYSGAQGLDDQNVLKDPNCGRWVSELSQQLVNLLNSVGPDAALAGRSFPSAEIQSFCFWLHSLPDDGSVQVSRVTLLPTARTPAERCAQHVMGILQHVFTDWGAVSRRVDSNIQVLVEPFYFDPSDPGRFAGACVDFLHLLWEKIEQASEHRKVVNITGGYKVLAPLMALFGFQRPDVEVVYQHEDSRVVVGVPPLPLEWDFKLLDDYRTLVGRRVVDVEPPPRLRAFFSQERTGWQLNPFGRVLKELYDEQRLERFGYGARLLRLLENDGDREDLRQRIRRWVHIWVGDVIPETVEHGRGHSQRLMEYAAELLEPIFGVDRKFLSRDELRCLVSCLWLHDIGHTALRLTLPQGSGYNFQDFLAACGFREPLAGSPGRGPRRVDISGFPNLVRLFHNFLSAQRILEYDYLSQEERQAVALISMYDRKAMPLTTNQPPWASGQVFGVQAPPLEEVLAGVARVPYGSNALEGPRVVLLCALLRVLDGLDVQSDRAVDDDYLRERTRRLRDEAGHLYGRLEAIAQNSSAKNVIDNVIDIGKLGEFYRSFESVLQTRDPCGAFDDLSRLVNEIGQFIKDQWLPALAKELNGSPSFADRELLSVIDRFLFKLVQPFHYCKHRAVRFVYIAPVPAETNPFRFRIYAVFSDGCGEEIKQQISREIWDEVEPVKDILSGYSINFEGVFDVAGGRWLVPPGG
jgi:hypothetical protein